MIHKSERGFSCNGKKTLANRSLQLKIRPTSGDISCNHKQPHPIRACYTRETYVKQHFKYFNKDTPKGVLYIYIYIYIYILNTSANRIKHIVQWTETCCRIFIIDYQYMLCFWLNKLLYYCKHSGMAPIKVLARAFLN